MAPDRPRAPGRRRSDGLAALEERRLLGTRAATTTVVGFQLIGMFSLCSRRTSLSLCFCDRSKCLTRNATFLKKGKSNSILDKSHHRIVYDFPGIRIIAAILKTKTWVPPVSFALAPVLYNFDETMISSVVLMLSACTYACTGLVLSKVARDTVGKIYVNKEGDVKDVLVSSVNKRGQRTDRIHNLEDIVTYDFPTPIHRGLGFITMGAADSSLVYKVNVRDCKFIDPGICMHLFGIVKHKNIQEEGKSQTKDDPKTKKISSV